ncbi:MAG: O-antigen ligase family protein [Oceanicaulis sp.]|nr:O-antigen ligase family protein [Oceanicaulis sp.]
MFLYMSFFCIAIIAVLLAISMYYVKKDSVDGRLLIWKVTTDMIAERPLLGHGKDSFKNTYNLYQARYFSSSKGDNQRERFLAGNVQHPHNEFLLIAVERGMFGLSVIVLLLLFIVLKLKPASSHIHYNEIISLRGGCLALIIGSMFSFPLHIHIIQYFFIMSCIMMIIYYYAPLVRIKQYSLNALALPCILILGLAYCYEDYRHQNIITLLNEATENTRYGNYAQAKEIYQNLISEYPYNGMVLFEYGSFQNRLGFHNDAIDVLENAIKVNTDPNLFIILGSSYENLGDIENAYLNYSTSYHIIPHKFYPLYLKMRMFQRNKYRDRAIDYANQIISMDEKLPSPATSQMKSEAYAFLATGVALWNTFDDYEQIETTESDRNNFIESLTSVTSSPYVWGG